MSTCTYLKITNPIIISFYQSNPHIDFEHVNLSILDILNICDDTSNKKSNCPDINGEEDIRINCNLWPQKNDTESSHILYPEKQKIKELESFLINLQNNINKLIKMISAKYIAIKTEYTRGLKTESKEQNARELFSKTNKIFFENICYMFSPIFCIRFSNISDKTKIIVNQFNKILNANTDQIFFKSDDAGSKIEDYLNNFESNSVHMIQAVIQLLMECVAMYELRVKQVS